jgi:hypothetical protein
MSWKKFVLLTPWAWKVNLLWGSVDDFDSIAALTQGSVAFDKCFGLNSGSTRHYREMEREL